MRRFRAGLLCSLAPFAVASAGAPAKPLEGVSWRLTGLPGQDAKALAALPRPVTVRFERGRVAGTSGCNRLTGSYEVEGDRVTLGPLAGTMMACPEPAMTIEAAFRAAFSGVVRYAVEGERLRLTVEKGAVLTFEAEPPPRLEGMTRDVTGFDNGRGVD